MGGLSGINFQSYVRLSCSSEIKVNSFRRYRLIVVFNLVMCDFWNIEENQFRLRDMLCRHACSLSPPATCMQVFSVSSFLYVSFNKVVVL